MNLGDIAEGWYNYIVAKPSVRSLMLKRLETCDVCPSKVQMSQAGITIVQLINKAGSVYKCNECQCPLAAKTSSTNEKCPLGKW